MNFKQGENICEMERELPVKSRKPRAAARNAADDWLTVFDGISELVCISDRDSRIVRANRALAEALNTSADALTGRDCREVLYGAECQCRDNFSQKRVGKDGRLPARSYLPRLGFIAEISCWALSDGSGRVLTIIRKVEQQKKTDGDTAEEKVWFRRMSETLPCAAFELDAAGNLVYANDVFLSITGYQAGDIDSGLNVSKLVDAGQVQKLQKDIGRVMAGTARGRAEYTVVSVKNKAIPVEILARSVRDSDGSPSGLLGLAFDISDRKRREETLQQNAQELDRIFNTAAGAMCIINRDYTIQRINNELAAVFNIDAAGAIGRKCHDVLQNICCNRIQCPMGLVTGGARRVEQEIEVQTAEKGNAAFHLTVVPYCSGSGEVLGLVSNFRDITDMKTVQRQLQQASLLVSLGEMTAGIAHEVNNPLSSILLYSELLMAGDVSPRMRKDLKLIHDEAERAARTMSELLNYARGVEASVSSVDLNTLVKQVLRVRGYQHSVKNVSVVRRLSRSPVRVLGDSNQLTQVIMNLILNAEDALHEKKGGVITVSTEGGNKWARLVISDTGRGIKEEHLQKIFFPFFSTKNNTHTQRSGLGLSVCYGIVTRHKGFIRAENNPEGGSSFIVELPVLKSKTGRGRQQVTAENDNEQT